MRIAKDYRSASLESYERFRKEHPSIRISYKKFAEIIYTFSYKLRNHVLETGDIIKFPHGMGQLSVNKKKTRRLSKDNKIILPIDWVETKKLGRRVYNFNDHTEGWKYKWWWSKRTALFKFHILWSFKPTRITSRKLAEYLKKTQPPYYLIYREYER